jgi:site-specific DNA-methyltransferase (adenine-specific)
MNRTLTLSQADRRRLAAQLVRPNGALSLAAAMNRTVLGDMQRVLDLLPERCADLFIADPPYNLRKDFNGASYSPVSLDEYEAWLHTWLPRVARVLKLTGSVYVCGDWRSSAAVQRALGRWFVVRNRITWEREKGRGAKANWKNCSEDIWFATASNEYTFNADAVKLKRRVLAPYTDARGRPKDWSDEADGRFRLTSPSNLWSDITVPFWSMPENTDHPTQKPEKLVAKLILASSREGDLVLDPFLGSGTTSVVALKLGRRFIGVDVDEEYCCIAARRIELAEEDRRIQGYEDGVFWERNAKPVPAGAEDASQRRPQPPPRKVRGDERAAPFPRDH